MSKTKSETKNRCQVIFTSSITNPPSISKIKTKVFNGITKNEPKYIVVDKNNVVYK